MDNHKYFPGTYFSKDKVLRLAGMARLFSWIIAGFYTCQWLFQIGSFIIQITRGFWSGIGFSDVAQNILWLFEQPLRGLVYFFILNCVAQGLYIFLDMEDNLRRAARNVDKKTASEG
jgi:hypothetical protein